MSVPSPEGHPPRPPQPVSTDEDLIPEASSKPTRFFPFKIPWRYARMVPARKSEGGCRVTDRGS
jgi:hypothetical protein